MEWSLASLPILIHVAIVFYFGARVVMGGRPTNATLAWLAVLLFAPYVGAVMYWLIGEHHLGARRAERAALLAEPIQGLLETVGAQNPVDWSATHPSAPSIERVALKMRGAPALSGNQLQLFSSAALTLASIRDDIDSARSTCHLLFYIWQPGGDADDVADALVRASERGVVCRVLVDYVGSNEFLESPQAERLRRSGVQIEDALEVGALRILFQRIDLRNHRKIVVIDGAIGYTGSMNLVDPRYFKRDARVGPWVDAMVRVVGPAVEVLNLVFLRDWELETEVGIEELVEAGDMRPGEPAGEDIVQIVPSTPGVQGGYVIHEVLLKTFFSAQRELIITTPYFVPTDTVVHALTTASYSGVEVTLVVPERVDSFLVRHASESTYERLLEAGVRVAMYRGGLLHSKTVSVDGQIAMIGSTNMDMRSFYINFEVTLLSYSSVFAKQLRALQQAYMDDADLLDLESWRRRPRGRRVLQSFVRLASPLL